MANSQRSQRRERERRGREVQRTARIVLRRKLKSGWREEEARIDAGAQAVLAGRQIRSVGPFSMGPRW